MIVRCGCGAVVVELPDWVQVAEDAAVKCRECLPSVEDQIKSAAAERSRKRNKTEAGRRYKRQYMAGYRVQNPEPVEIVNQRSKRRNGTEARKIYMRTYMQTYKRDRREGEWVN